MSVTMPICRQLIDDDGEVRHAVAAMARRDEDIRRRVERCARHDAVKYATSARRDARECYC